MKKLHILVAIISFGITASAHHNPIHAPSLLSINTSIYKPGYEVYNYWSGTAWVQNDSTVYTYNTQGLALEEDEYISNILSQRALYTYDAAGNEATVIYQDNISSSLVNTQKYEYTYNSNELNTLTLLYNWDDPSSSWVVEDRDTTIYNSSMLMTLETTTSPLTGYVSQESYLYDGNNNLIQEISQSGSGTTWTNSFKSSYTYSSGLLTLNQSFNWNGSWQPTTQITDYQYNQTVEISEVEQTWNGTTYVNNIKDTYTYNADGKDSLDKSQTWNGTAWEDDTYQRFLYVYDSNNNLLQLIDQDGDVNLNFTNDQEFLYGNYHLYVGVPVIKNDNDFFTLYPNPISDEATLKLKSFADHSEFILSGISGNILQDIQFSGDQLTISKNNLPAGFYVYRVISDGKIEGIGKLIIN